MQKLLITGGSGYLGGELVRHALATGQWDVTATYANNWASIDGAHVVQLDVRDQQSVSMLIHAAAPDVILHTAYVQHNPDLWAITAEGAGHVAHAARELGARLIHLSSDALFDGERQGFYTENDPPSPITPYGEAKAGAERLVAERYPAALIVRTSLIYGGTTPSPHEQLVLRALNADTEIAFFTDELRSPVQVGDLASALLELASTNLGGVLHVAGADVVSRYEFACLIARHAGEQAERLRSGSSALSGARRPRNVALDITRAQALLTTRLRGARTVLKDV
ncbi:MAG: SDR family oxidoreductase [Roseiflexaceae bacterium]|nr:SDR family oxidoreductase [Roseiflexaceae bacterium]